MLFFLFALCSDEPEVFLPEYSQTAILHAAHFRVVKFTSLGLTGNEYPVRYVHRAAYVVGVGNVVLLQSLIDLVVHEPDTVWYPHLCVDVCGKLGVIVPGVHVVKVRRESVGWVCHLERKSNICLEQI